VGPIASILVQVWPFSRDVVCPGHGRGAFETIGPFAIFYAVDLSQYILSGDYGSILLPLPSSGVYRRFHGDRREIFNAT
jgi:hypothetical protein